MFNKRICERCGRLVLNNTLDKNNYCEICHDLINKVNTNNITEEEYRITEDVFGKYSDRIHEGNY